MAISPEDSTASTVASAVVTGLATLCVALRFVARLRIKAGIAWDDWFILLGLLMTLLTGSLLLWGNKVDPTGAMAVDNSAQGFDYPSHVTFLKLCFLTSLLYFSMISAIKLSILLMYCRIFSVDAAFRVQSLLLGIVVVMFWLATTVATLANCIPIKYSWISLSDPAHCFNFNIFWMATGALEVVIDTMILALPVRMVLGLQLSYKRKVFLLFIFLLGGFVIITGIIRVIYGYVPGGRVLSFSKSQLWSAVHIGTAMICACLPTLRPLFFRGPSTSASATTSSSFSAFSTMRRRYEGFRKWNPKDDSRSNAGGRSGTQDVVEELPLTRRNYAESTV